MSYESFEEGFGCVPYNATQTQLVSLAVCFRDADVHYAEQTESNRVEYRSVISTRDASVVQAQHLEFWRSKYYNREAYSTAVLSTSRSNISNLQLRDPERDPATCTATSKSHNQQINKCPRPL